jgi:hypothetical protein
MMSNKHISKPLDVSGLSSKFKRADIIVTGVDHSGASFEGRVFFNNGAADESTPKTAASGYAGSFHILGHGGCFGDVGHCEIQGEQRRFDTRPSHALAPVKKTVVATDAVRRVQDAGAKTVEVTIVPVITGTSEKCDLTNVLKLDDISIVTYH